MVKHSEICTDIDKIKAGFVRATSSFFYLCPNPHHKSIREDLFIILIYFELSHGKIKTTPVYSLHFIKVALQSLVRNDNVRW